MFFNAVTFKKVSKTNLNRCSSVGIILGGQLKDRPWIAGRSKTFLSSSRLYRFWCPTVSYALSIGSTFVGLDGQGVNLTSQFIYFQG